MSTPPSGIHLVIGVTAHRDIPVDQHERLVERMDALFNNLRKACPDLPLLMLNPLADGGDRLAARVARMHGIPLIVPLPFAQAEYERDFVEPASLDEFRSLLVGAEIRELPLATGIFADDILDHGPARDRQYAQLGMYVSSHCQILLALWDGLPHAAEGGTAQVVHFHLHNVMSGIAAKDIAPNLLADDDSDLIYHVHCGRESSTAGQPKQAPGSACWLTMSGALPDAPLPPPQYMVVLRQMEALNEDIARHHEAIANSSARLLLATPAPVPEGAERLESLFVSADWLAIHYQRSQRTTLLVTHVIAMLMGLAFILYSDLAAMRLFVGFFLAFFVLGLGVSLLAKHRQWHRKYLDYRGLAEGLRVQLYWDLAGVDVPANSSFGYDSFLQKQDVELSWIRHAMRDAALARTFGERSDPRWIPWVEAQWVGDADGEGGQLAYFRNGTNRRLQAFRTTRRFGRASLLAGIGGAVVLLVVGDSLSSSFQQWLILAMGLLPLAAGIRETYSFKKADKELIKQYGFMTRLFEGCRDRLKQAKDASDVREILLALGRACLDEHAEWILLHRERPLEHETSG